MLQRVRLIALAALVTGAASLSTAAPAGAVFHFAHMSEILTGYNGGTDVQFVEITMDVGGQSLVKEVRLNTFDEEGKFVATVLTVPSNVESGTERPWIMGTPAFEIASGIEADFEFPNGSLPVNGGMVCWGQPGDSPTPIECPSEGTPYVDCIAYGTYSGPSNECIGTPHPIAPNGHSLHRIDDTPNNAIDFRCANPATPTNNANEVGSLPLTIACPDASTTTTIIIIDTTSTTVTTTTTSTTTSTTTPTPTTSTTTMLPGGVVCGDANDDGSLTASDALGALRTAVGSGSCPAGVCDVDLSGSVSAADALRILARAVGQDVALDCPAA